MSKQSRYDYFASREDAERLMIENQWHKNKIKTSKTTEEKPKNKTK